MKENEFAKRLTKAFRDCNGCVLSIVGGRMQQPGWPDIYVAHTFWRGFVEFKGERTELRDQQKRLIRKLWERKSPCYVIRCPDRIEDTWGNILAVFNTQGEKYGVVSAVSILKHLALLDKELLK